MTRTINYTVQLRGEADPTLYEVALTGEHARMSVKDAVESLTKAFVESGDDGVITFEHTDGGGLDVLRFSEIKRISIRITGGDEA